MWQMVGHEWAVALLRGAMETGRLAHAYLFTGSAHVGKTRLTTDLASAILCTGDEPPCGVCASCRRIAQGMHPDVSLVQPDNGRIKIDQIRSLQRELVLSPHRDAPRKAGGAGRLAIITEFQTATLEAANALLKTLEEPPGRVILLLTATDASLLLPTIVSRCQLMPLRALAGQQIEDALRERWHVDPPRAHLIASLAAGRMGWAISAAEGTDVLAQRQQQLEALQKLLRQGPASRIQAAERLGKRQDLDEIMQLWQTWWRDVALLASGCGELVVNLDYVEALRQQAQQHGLVQACGALRGIEAAQQQIEQNVNPRLALEVLLLGWGRVDLGGHSLAA
jgi:DNA polymerase-3 subunit delta'